MKQNLFFYILDIKDISTQELSLSPFRLFNCFLSIRAFGSSVRSTSALLLMYSYLLLVSWKSHPFKFIQRDWLWLWVSLIVNPSVRLVALVCQYDILLREIMTSFFYSCRNPSYYTDFKVQLYPSQRLEGLILIDALTIDRFVNYTGLFDKMRMKSIFYAWPMWKV